ncbi:hypothetical protein CCYA_CCYA12G3325 [Cyanidiococcus yangmingshanensis]|uniref:Uncharacterized protein n=1 Tax=Cyanidiococcus yangmingshanensis TaxID=2690220 RepID=A0A7J7II09_9RHOD|nr:hypothetical protein F1559_002313 [Cyanidiococcus yangmingshanensis]KAK4532468.1 hypothetical protein CCYA_CCYA12G3325 [Cyanidiococcus yangmingshanensis]
MESTEFGVPEVDRFLEQAEFRLERLKRTLVKLAEKQRKLQRKGKRHSDKLLQEVTANSLASAYALQSMFSLLLCLEGEDPGHHVVKRSMERCCHWASVFALEVDQAVSPAPVSDAAEERSQVTSS